MGWKVLGEGAIVAREQRQVRGNHITTDSMRIYPLALCFAEELTNINIVPRPPRLHTPFLNL